LWADEDTDLADVDGLEAPVLSLLALVRAWGRHMWSKLPSGKASENVVFGVVKQVSGPGGPGGGSGLPCS
jgi:hypothetical protein